jgi:hypothetical protein
MGLHVGFSSKELAKQDFIPNGYEISRPGNALVPMAGFLMMMRKTSRHGSMSPQGDNKEWE